MKLKELKSILYSNRGCIQHCIVYDSSKDMDVEDGCTVEYAIEHYGDREVKHIEALNDDLIITI